MTNNNTRNLKVKITYHNSDDIFVCDLMELKVVEHNDNDTAKTIEIKYFDQYSAEGYKTLYLNQRDIQTTSIEISSAWNKKDDSYREWI